MRRTLMTMMAGAALIAAFLVQVGPAQTPAPKQTAKAPAKASARPNGKSTPRSRRATGRCTAATSPVRATLRSNRSPPRTSSKMEKAWSYRPAAPRRRRRACRGQCKGRRQGQRQRRTSRARRRGGVDTHRRERSDVRPRRQSSGGAGCRHRQGNLDATGPPAATSRRAASDIGRAMASNPARVLYTVGTNMFALNAATGNTDPGFGKEGVVNIEITWGGAPYVYKNLIIMGNNNGERTDGPAGDTKVYDARTGAELWRFKTMVQPGDKNFEGAWLNDSWKQQRAGLNVWGWYFSVDEERDLIFMPVGSAAGNYYGGDRPGNNLYGNSIVAVNATTGKYVWHFQLVHHDLWDTDVPAAPSLFDVKKDGKTIPALAVISKNALMFILNRETGEPIHGVEERPVPKGDVPGEWYSPTQPFPVKPPPLVRMSFNKDGRFRARFRYHAGAREGLRRTLGQGGRLH